MTQGLSCDTLTSIQASSFASPESSLDLLLPLTACRLLGGAPSSTAPDAGLFRSSILAKVAGRGSADGEVAIGIRKDAAKRRTKLAKGNKRLKIGIRRLGVGEMRPVVLVSATPPRKMKLKGESLVVKRSVRFGNGRTERKNGSSSCRLTKAGSFSKAASNAPSPFSTSAQQSIVLSFPAPPSRAAFLNAIPTRNALAARIHPDCPKFNQLNAPFSVNGSHPTPNRPHLCRTWASILRFRHHIRRCAAARVSLGSERRLAAGH